MAGGAGGGGGVRVVHASGIFWYSGGDQVREGKVVGDLFGPSGGGSSCRL